MRCASGSRIGWAKILATFGERCAAFMYIRRVCAAETPNRSRRRGGGRGWEPYR